MAASTLSLEAVLLDVLWQTTAWLALGVLLSLALARRPARAHGALWLCLVGAVVTPVATALFRWLGWGVFLPGPAALMTAQGILPDPASAARPIAGGGPTWQHLLVAAWLALSAVALARLVLSVVRGRRLLSSARPGVGPRLRNAGNSVAARLGLRCSPDLLVSERVTCPVIWCWGRRPYLLVPARIADGADALDLSGVLCHELAHYKRRDHLATLTGELVICLLPWHPLAWLAQRRLRDQSEEACDAWVLATGASPDGYAESLLDLIPQAPPALALAAAGSRGGVARRLFRILGTPPGNPRLGRHWIAGTIVLGLLLAGAAAVAHRRPVEPDAGDATTNLPESLVAELDRDSAGVSVLPRELDLGVGLPEQPKAGEFWLVNTGPKPREVLRVKPSCGCTTVTEFQPAVLAPGQSMRVEISMTAPGSAGDTKTKHVTVYVEDQKPFKLPVHLKAAGPGELP